MPPSQYFRLRALSKARSTLLAGNRGVRVGESAIEAGFSNLGRFSRLYKDVFGELPSKTLINA